MQLLPHAPALSGTPGRRRAALIAVWLVALISILLGMVARPVAASASGLAPAGVPAAACTTKPTIVMVHGVWADAYSWRGEIDRLQPDGYVVRAIANPLRGLTSDAADVADFLKTIRGPIVLVGHSYGGSVITNAATGNPNVKALVYVDAAAPAPGETTAQLSGADSALSAAPATLYDRVPLAGAGEGLYLKERPFLRSFAPDLVKGTARRLWASQRPAATRAFMTPSATAAWRTIPSWYVIGGADKIITPASQTAMAKRAHARIMSVPGGSHLTLISHPHEVTQQIRAAARAACAST